MRTAILNIVAIIVVAMFASTATSIFILNKVSNPDTVLECRDVGEKTFCSEMENQDLDDLKETLINELKRTGNW